MKNEKPKLKEKEKTDSTDQQAIDTSETLKKKKKAKSADETATTTAAPKVKKSKSEKAHKEMVEPDAPKAPKDDKLTKFLVSMKKTVRKSIKKEAAETGVSMNEFILSAIEAKLGQDTQQ